MSEPPKCKRCGKPMTQTNVSPNLRKHMIDFWECCGTKTMTVPRRDDAGSSRQELKERALKDKEQSRDDLART